MVEGGHPDSVHIRCRCAASERSAPGGGEDTSTGSGRVPPAAGRTTRCVFRDGARQGAWASGQERGEPFPRPWRRPGLLVPGVPGVGGARGRERAGPTRSHPEPGRDPAQRRRVLWGRPHGRRGRRGHPPPSTRRGRQHRADGQDDRRAKRSWPIAESRSLIAESPSRGGAAAARWAHNPKVGGSNPPPATRSKSDRAQLLGRFLLF